MSALISHVRTMLTKTIIQIIERAELFETIAIIETIAMTKIAKKIMKKMQRTLIHQDLNDTVSIATSLMQISSNALMSMSFAAEIVRDQKIIRKSIASDLKNLNTKFDKSACKVKISIQIPKTSKSSRFVVIYL